MRKAVLHCFVMPALVLGIALTGEVGLAASFASGDEPALHRGVYEVNLAPGPLPGNPFFETRAKVKFTRSDGSESLVDAFYDGKGTWRARAYCDQIGRWRWRSQSATKALVGIELPAGEYGVRWFNPRTGEWIDGVPVKSGMPLKLTAPAPKRAMAGDWVLLMKRQ